MVCFVLTGAQEMRILLATDGSPEARAAEDWVIGLPLARSDSVNVLTVLARGTWSKLRYVVDRIGRGTHRRSSLTGAAATDIAASARQRLAARVPSSSRVRSGTPSEQILETAHEIRPDLLVIGARKRSTLQRHVLGSVSERVAREATSSVAVVHAPTTPRRILLAVDGSFHARATVDLLSRLTRPEDATAVVLAPMAPLKPAMLAAHTTDTWCWLLSTHHDRQRLAQVLARETAEAFGLAGWRADLRLAEDPSSQAVIAAAERHESDLIVVGAGSASSRHRSPLSGVARAILRRARCSVLIARTNGEPTCEREDKAFSSVQAARCAE